MNIEALLIAVVVAAASYGGGYFHGRQDGADSVQVEWDAEKFARTQAENATILSRVKNNERIAAQQETDCQRIEKTRHDELAQVRADIARAPRLRIGPAICAGFAGSAQATTAGSSDGADSGGRLLSPEMDRDIKALIEETERVTATGRACQDFLGLSSSRISSGVTTH